MPRLAPANLVGKDGHLRASVIHRVEHLVTTQSITMGQIAERLGYRRLDPRLGFAMHRRSRPTAELLERLARLFSGSK